MLNGALLAFLPQGQQTLHLFIALQLSLSIVIITLWTKPYKSDRSNTLSIVVSAALAWVILGAVGVRFYQSIATELEVDGVFRISAIVGALTDDASAARCQAGSTPAAPCS